MVENDNEGTYLIFEDYEDSKIIEGNYFGIGFVTSINDKYYRGAVKIPKGSNHEFWKKAFLRLRDMLNNPTNKESGCISGHTVLIGNEVEIK